uniref:Uncharacterized protein n=1 Tax=Dromaius novaehollandiae TaxID=8790 RepID=A0A8C4K908_DRONO
MWLCVLSGGGVRNLFSTACEQATSSASDSCAVRRRRTGTENLIKYPTLAYGFRGLQDDKVSRNVSKKQAELLHGALEKKERLEELSNMLHSVRRAAAKEG